MKNTNFGACVFYAENNVVDHQVVNIQFEGGVTASLTMNGFNKGGRYIRVFGTKGELYANASDAEITVYPFDTRTPYTISDGKQTPEEVKEAFKSHGYSAVCYKDYEVLISHKELCDDEFVALHGYEMGILSRESSNGIGRKCYHLNMIAKNQDNLTMH